MACTDIFGRKPLQFGGAFAADSANIELIIPCDTDGDGYDEEFPTCGLLTQNLSIQYQQPITRLYEVGSQFTYYVAGRPQGTATIARILGPGAVIDGLYECLGNVCNADKNDICFCLQAGCATDIISETACGTAQFSSVKLGLKNVVLQGIGFSVQAQDMVINEQMSLFFTAMLAEYSEDGCQSTEYEFDPPACFDPYTCEEAY